MGNPKPIFYELLILIEISPATKLIPLIINMCQLDNSIPLARDGKVKEKTKSLLPVHFICNIAQRRAEKHLYTVSIYCTEI